MVGKGRQFECWSHLGVGGVGIGDKHWVSGQSFFRSLQPERKHKPGLTFEQILWCILFHVCLLAATSYMTLFISLEHRYPDYMQHFRDSDSGVQTSSSRGIIIIMYILAVILIFLKGVWKVCKVL